MGAVHGSQPRILLRPDFGTVVRSQGIRIKFFDHRSGQPGDFNCGHDFRFNPLRRNRLGTECRTLALDGYSAVAAPSPLTSATRCLAAPAFSASYELSVKPPRLMSSSTRSIDILLREIPDIGLRARLRESVDSLRKQTRFGLVFEGHHPEVSRLPNVPVRRGCLVVLKAAKDSKVLFKVREISGTVAICVPAVAGVFEEETSERIPVSDLVVTRRFGDPIYPSLHLVDSIARSPNKPWHLLLQADNYHALQALLYTHEEKIDCMYLDPPYNTGARDWKYNNDYVDGSDPWKHSKWLSFMEKRLEIAKKLLKPDGVIIITIDEHEVHHLGCLIEQLLRDFYRQMVTIIVNPKGVTQGRFSRVEEYALFCFRGEATVKGIRDDLLTPDSGLPVSRSPRWKGLLRSGTNARRVDRKNMFFPVIVDPKRQAVLGVGESLLPHTEKPDFDLKIKGHPVAWPIRTDGSEGNWGVGATTLNSLIEKGYVKLGEYDSKRKTWALSYLSRKPQQQIKDGILAVKNFDKVRNVVEVEYTEERERQLKTVWHRTAHDAGAFGSDLLKNILGEAGKFPFPKSLYAVRDALTAVVRDKPNAIVLDFFGGSGTTLNAINLMNATDGGQRQCILVTNNEVSEEESKRLTKANHAPGDPEWEVNGICRGVTWPRNKFTIAGKRDDGTQLKGEYLTGKWSQYEIDRAIQQLSFAEGNELDLAKRRDIARLISGISVSAVSEQPWHLEEDSKASILWDASKVEDWIEELKEADSVTNLYVVTADRRNFREIVAMLKESLPPLITEREEAIPIKDGFKENLAYFEVGFLDPDDVARGEAFAGVLPLLWMIAGSKAACPSPTRIGKWLISPDCGFAVLHKDTAFQDFLEEIKGKPMAHVFLVTDSEDSFKEMRAQLPSGTETHMLYSSYLRNFRINTSTSL